MEQHFVGVAHGGGHMFKTIKQNQKGCGVLRCCGKQLNKLESRAELKTVTWNHDKLRILI